MLSYSQAEPGRELTQPSPSLLAEPCSCNFMTQSDVIFNGPFVSTGTPDAGSVGRVTKGLRPKIASVGRTAEKRMHA